MKRAPHGGGAADSGRAIGSIIPHLTYTRCHLLTDGRGRYVALLCRERAVLVRLGERGRA
jgi:hypothetical protein